MKSNKLIIILISLVFAGGLSAQKIVMKIEGITPTQGEPIKALEFKIDTEEPLKIGTDKKKAIPRALLIKKDCDSSTAAFFKNIVLSRSFDEISFEYYEEGTKPVKTYIITLYGATLTQLQWLTPECPGCLGIEHQIGFDFIKIKMEDHIRKTVVNWDINSGKVN